MVSTGKAPVVRFDERHASSAQSTVVLAGGVPTGVVCRGARVRTVFCSRDGEDGVLSRSPVLILVLWRMGLVDGFVEVNIRSVLLSTEAVRVGTARDSRGARVRVESRSGRSVPRGPRVGGIGVVVAISRDVSNVTVGVAIVVVFVIVVIPSLLMLTMLVVAVTLDIATVETLDARVEVNVNVAVVAAVDGSVAMVVLLATVDVTDVLSLPCGTVLDSG